MSNLKSADCPACQHPYFRSGSQRKNECLPLPPSTGSEGRTAVSFVVLADGCFREATNGVSTTEWGRIADRLLSTPTRTFAGEFRNTESRRSRPCRPQRHSPSQSTSMHGGSDAYIRKANYQRLWQSQILAGLLKRIAAHIHNRQRPLIPSMTAVPPVLAVFRQP
jgi:hypothetical protein